jgi:hypothetical protein
MTDFFGNLAARTLAEPTLRPRTRGRFEPEGPELLPAPPEAEGEAAPAAAPDVEQRPGVERVSALPRPSSPAPRDEEPLRGPRAGVPAATPRRPPAVARPEPAAASEAEPPAPPRAEERRRGAPRVDGALPHRFAHEAPRIRGSRRPGPEPRSERPSPSSREAPAATPAGVEAPAWGRAPAAHTTPEAQRGKTEAAAPVVQVSIGRVEVRATAAPGPARRPATRPRPLSIEDYADRRDARRERR